jgi:hypothetical protein
MASFAELDENNIVLRVVVVNNGDILDDDGNESEQKGIDICNSICGQGTWLQCSYNGTRRGTYPGIGYRYDAERDIFVAPPCPESLTPAPQDG